MSDLSQRTLTAIALILLVITLIFKMPTIWFSGFLALVALSALYEFSKLTQLKPIYLFFIIVFIVAFLMFMRAEGSRPHGEGVLFILVLLVAFVFWLKNLVLVFNYPNKKPKKHPIFHVLNIILWLVSLLGWAMLNQDNKSLLILLLLIVASADSFAYFTGKAFGKHKLAPNLSSGKTIEGVIGGLVGALLITSLWMFVTNSIAWQFLLITLITVAFSVVGDLYESIYKREAGVKDSGKLLPGHGGVLDRIDGLLAATPVFMLGISLL